jgi:hypothetical protein
MNARREKKRAREIFRNHESARWFLILLCVGVSFLLLFGCKSAPQVAVEVAPGQYQLPVEHHNVDLPAGWEKEEGTARIVIPPSTEPVVLTVRERPRSLAKRLFPSRSATTVDVVSSSKAVTVTQEPKTPWWWWAAGIGGGLGALWFLGKKYLGPLPLIVKKIFKIIRRIRK